MIELDAAIIGGGFSGCAVTANLARRAGSNFSLALFETDDLGRGAAYGTPHREHLLNTRAHQMSLFCDDADHFVRWLGPRGGGADFMPRQLYGDYVGEIVRHALDRPRFTRIHDRVAGVRRAPDDAFILETESGTRVRARAVVLAVGNLPPNDDFLPFEARLHPGYVADPWRFDYRVVGGQVLVIGSGLSALDVLVALKAGGHRGMVHIVSRGGRFARVHADVAPYDVIPALDTGGTRALVRSFRRHLKDAAERGFDWRAVVDALRPEAEAIWKRLSAVDQQRFNRHVRPHWDRHRHRAPQQVDAVRTEYANARRLSSYAGRFVKMERGSVTIALRSGGRVALRPDWIVNCSGLGRGATMTRDPLLRSMLADDLISSGGGGLGLHTAPDLVALGKDGNRVPGLWIVGPLVRGSRFEATAVPELRVMAEETATAILHEQQRQNVFLEAFR